MIKTHTPVVSFPNILWKYYFGCSIVNGIPGMLWLIYQTHNKNKRIGPMVNINTAHKKLTTIFYGPLFQFHELPVIHF